MKRTAARMLVLLLALPVALAPLPAAAYVDTSVSSGAWGKADAGGVHVQLYAWQGGFCVAATDRSTGERHHGCSSSGGISDGLTSAGATGTVDWTVPEQTTTTKRNRTETTPARSGTLTVDVRWEGDGDPTVREQTWWSGGGCLLVMYDCAWGEAKHYDLATPAALTGTVVDSEWGMMLVEGRGELVTSASYAWSTGRL